MRKESSRLKAIQPHLPLIMALVGSSILGASPIFVRMVDIGSNAIGFYRMSMALPIMWLWMKIEERANPKSHITPNRRELYLLSLAGFFFAMDLATWHMSIYMTSIINSAIFNNLTPIFVPLLIWALYKNRPTMVYVVSALTAIVGSAILTGSTITLDADNFAGDMLAITSAVAYSGYIILVKNLRGKFNAPTILFWTSFSNMTIMAILAFYMDEKMALTTWQDWVGVLGLAFLVHGLGQGLLAYSMGKLSAAFVSITMLLSPVISAGLGWIAFGETISWIQSLGCVIVLSSIITARTDEKKEK